MSRLFVIQVAGISNWEMIEKGENDLNMFLWRCHWQGNTSRLVLCLQIISQDCSSKEMGELTCEREELRDVVRHPMFSQALMQEGKQPPSHKGRCGSCQIQALNPSDLCLHPSCPVRGWEPGWTPGAEGRSLRLLAGGLSFLHLPHSSALCFGSMRS